MTKKRREALIYKIMRFTSHTKLTAGLYVADYILCVFIFMFLESKSLLDAIWWCTVTWFTVGYGDMYPLTTPGRVFAIYAIVSSHILIVLVTANFVAKLSQYKLEASRLEEQQKRGAK